MSVEKAINFAFQKHSGQKRKVSGEPYIVHPVGVFIRLKEMGCSIEMQIVGLLHDTLEDTATTYEELEKEFGKSIADMVLELTNPSKKHPELKREIRKAMDREHLNTVSKEAKIVKLLDRISNLKEMLVYRHSQKFARIYLEESLKLAEALKDASGELYTELKATIDGVAKSYLL